MIYTQTFAEILGNIIYFSIISQPWYHTSSGSPPSGEIRTRLSHFFVWNMILQNFRNWFKCLFVLSHMVCKILLSYLMLFIFHIIYHLFKRLHVYSFNIFIYICFLYSFSLVCVSYLMSNDFTSCTLLYLMMCMLLLATSTLFKGKLIFIVFTARL